MRKFEIAKGFEHAGVNLPARSTRASAGYDFEAAETVTIKMGEEKPTLVPTGIKATFPDDEVLLLFNRSSNPLKKYLCLANGVGVIDSDYYSNEKNDGHIMFQFLNLGFDDVTIHKGDKIGQGVFQKFLLTEDDQAEGKREGGFGSTGK